MTSELITSRSYGPVLLALSVPLGTVRVIVEDRDHAEITIQADAETGPFADAVREAARSAQQGQDAEGAWMDVTVPDIAGGGATTVITGRGGSTVINNMAGGTTFISQTQTFGNVSIGGSFTGATVIGGNVVIGGSGSVAAGTLDVVARLPRGSSLKISAGLAQVDCTGSLDRLDFRATAGGLDVAEVYAVRAQASSGTLRVGTASRVEARSSSGDIRIRRAADVTASASSGDITVAGLEGNARLQASSGSVSVHAVIGGQITATASSGDVSVTATDAALAEGLDIDAHTNSGRTYLPTTTVTGSVRPRIGDL
jgi:hypothetical protein